MKETIIATGTVTYAIKGRDLLKRAGFSARIARDFGGSGCGYGISVKGDAQKALELLRKAGIKVYEIKEQ